MQSGARGIIVLLAALLTIGAQPPQSFAQSLPAFEVASVKPQPWKGQGSVGVFFHGNTLSGEHCDLYTLIEFAWNVQEFQLSGGPPWARHGLLATSELYQVIGKTGDSPASDANQLRLMLRALLADRFQLKIHHMSKDVPVFYLVVAKNGSRLKSSPENAKGSLLIDSSSRKLVRITATRIPIAQFIGSIGYYAGRPIFDKTGLAGPYDFLLEWTPDNFAAAGPGVDVSDPVGPSLFTALQTQLGLKLEPAIASFDTLVIDHAEKPSTN
jgi:uncharacterized protein (TIGR03435 family)